jgi:hypothetical protein
LNLWLDDIRPAPPGWTHVKTVEEAIKLMVTGKVVKASLDHDLGACEACMSGMSLDEWLEKSSGQSTPNCNHFGTGYQFVCWMEEYICWPKEKPTVHSMNPVGRAKMIAAIEHSWRPSE